MEHEITSTLFGLSKGALAAIILVVSYIFIALEKLPKVTIAMFGAALTLAFKILPAESAFSHVDFGVIVLLVSMMIIVHIASRSGVFNWLAIEVLKLTKGSPIKILVSIAFFTAIFSAFLDNVTTVVLLLPITFVIAREIKIDPMPLLITEILASNIGGTATLIGDPPNIIIGSAAGLGFNDFILELTPVISVVFIVCMFIIVMMFKSQLVSTPEQMKLVAGLDNSKSIKDKTLLVRSCFVLLLVILGFVINDYTFHLETYMIALLGASVLLMFEPPAKILQDVEWITIFFFIGLFIIIGGVEETGGIEYLANQLLNFTKGDLSLTSVIIIWGSGFLSAIVDNIPYTVTMVPLIKSLSTSMDVMPLWWSLSLGACLGGNATIIGAAANVIVSESAYAAGHPISFFRFMKYGLIVTFVSLTISTIYIYFKYLI